MEKTVKNDQLRKGLEKKLHEEKAFWSYDKSSIVIIPDDVLIEKVLLHLDIEDIQILFLLFPKRKIQKVWQEAILVREPLYHGLNRLYAFLFFNIEHPDRYIRYYKKKRLKSLLCKD
ncbi:MAG TPA: hypothetical protein VMV77_10730 [Bacteroidales bacterium]|nr:hypothetical protein [Bacteroidales bacterium]